MITGYIASTEGTVKIDGHDILEEPEGQRNVSVICLNSRRSILI
ncbi:MAG: hypothetical protein ACLRWM_04655 [Streptococcus sp.]